MKVMLVGLLFLGVGAIHSGATMVKLCGKDFVRAVVYVCGVSRWRRQLGDTFSEELRWQWKLHREFKIPKQRINPVSRGVRERFARHATEVCTQKKQRF